MKKQYEAIWFTIDGNRHSLWPIYAETQEDASSQTIDFIKYQKKENFITPNSLLIKLT